MNCLSSALWAHLLYYFIQLTILAAKCRVLWRWNCIYHHSKPAPYLPTFPHPSRTPQSCSHFRQAGPMVGCVLISPGMPSLSSQHQPHPISDSSDTPSSAFYKTVPNSLPTAEASSEPLPLPLIWQYMLSQECCWPREATEHISVERINWISLILQGLAQLSLHLKTSPWYPSTISPLLLEFPWHFVNTCTIILNMPASNLLVSLFLHWTIGSPSAGIYLILSFTHFLW